MSRREPQDAPVQQHLSALRRSASARRIAVVPERDPADQAPALRRRLVAVPVAGEDRPGRFEVDVVPDRERIIVVPQGEIDLATVGAVRRRLDEVEVAGFDHVVLDLRKVTFLDSTGLHLIVEVTRKEGLDFSVIRGSDAVHRVFELTGLVHLIPFVDR